MNGTIIISQWHISTPGTFSSDFSLVQNFEAASRVSCFVLFYTPYSNAKIPTATITSIVLEPQYLSTYFYIALLVYL